MTNPLFQCVSAVHVEDCSQALRAARRLPQLQLVRVAGAAARSFLQRQLTADVAALSPGAATLAAWCTAQGRVIADFVLWQEAAEWVQHNEAGESGAGAAVHDHTARRASAPNGQMKNVLPATAEVFCLLMARDLAADVVQKMQRYVLRDPVRLSLDSAVVLATFPHAEVNAENFGNSEKSEKSENSANITNLGKPIRCIRLADGRALWTVPAETAADLAVDSLPDGIDPWHVADVAAGWTLLGAAASALFVPQMLALDKLQAVSFNKGCYPGQEVVARSHYLGQVKRQLYRASAAAEVAVGAAVRLLSAPNQDGADQGTNVGNVLLAAADGQGSWQLLLVAKTDALAEHEAELRAGEIRLSAVQAVFPPKA